MNLLVMIQSLRRRYSGAIPLSECERHAALIQKGREDRMEAERLREEARKDRDQARVCTWGLFCGTTQKAQDYKQFGL